MQFGVCVATKIDDWQMIKYAEELGYDRAWIPDSQMIWSDCYATLALVAQNTSRHGYAAHAYSGLPGVSTGGQDAAAGGGD